jgi:hypothetical protein
VDALGGVRARVHAALYFVLQNRLPLAGIRRRATRACALLVEFLVAAEEAAGALSLMARLRCLGDMGGVVAGLLTMLQTYKAKVESRDRVFYGSDVEWEGMGTRLSAMVLQVKGYISGLGLGCILRSDAYDLKCNACDAEADGTSRREDRGSGGGSRSRSRSRGGDERKEGARVEARYKRSRMWYPGKVSRVCSDGTFDISYDDGEKELGVYEDSVRLVERGGGRRADSAERGDSLRDRPHRGGSGCHGGDDCFERGSKVEAYYRGGTKLYPGVISRVRLNGSCDIDYDDGEQEIGVDRGLIQAAGGRGGGPRPARMASPPGRSYRAEEEDAELPVGSKVKAYYCGGTKLYPGVISRIRLNGSCDIDYDDGEQEIGVDRGLIQAAGGRGGGSRSRGGGASTAPIVFEQGDRVEANYKGHGKFYPGVIAAVNGSHDNAYVYHIDYDDGEFEKRVEVVSIRAADRPHRDWERERDRSVVGSGDEVSHGGGGSGGTGGVFEVGDRVEARYKEGTKFYRGVIARVRLNGRCDIDYDDGEKELGVKGNLIRLWGEHPAGHTPAPAPALVPPPPADPPGSPGKVSTWSPGKDDVADDTHDTATYASESRDRDDGSASFILCFQEEEAGFSLVTPRGALTEIPRAAEDPAPAKYTIEARFRGRSKWHKGRVDADGACVIHFEEGEEEVTEPPEDIRPIGGTAGGSAEMEVEMSSRGRGGGPDKLEQGSIDTANCSEVAFKVGDAVEYCSYTANTAWTAGVVARVGEGGGSYGVKPVGTGSRPPSRGTGNPTVVVSSDLVRARSAGGGGAGAEADAPPARRASDRSDTGRGEGEGGAAEAGLAADDADLCLGCRVLARLHGESQYVPGLIVNENDDGTFDVERTADPTGDPSAAAATTDTADATGVGAEAEAGAADNSYIGVVFASVMRDMIRVDARHAGLSVGAGVEYSYGAGSPALAVITAVQPNGTFDIELESGDREAAVKPDMLTALAQPSRAEKAAAGAKERAALRAVLREGCAVQARCRGGSRWYDGVVTRVRDNNTFDIDYADGEQEISVIINLIRLPVVDADAAATAAATAAAAAAADADADAATRVYREGDRVVAERDGRGCRSGVVARAGAAGSHNYDIKFDDGILIRRVAAAALRPAPVYDPVATAAAALTALEAVSSSLTRSADLPCLDDAGNTTITTMFDESSQAKSGSNSEAAEAAAGGGEGGVLEQGARVEANFKGHGNFYPGKISRVRLNGTCDIDYDDGEQELGVDRGLIQAAGGRGGGSLERGGSRSGGGEGEGAEARDDPSALQVGTRVEAAFRGGYRFYLGTVSCVNADGTYTIDYDDGERERGVEEAHIRVKGAAGCRSAARDEEEGEGDMAGSRSLGGQSEPPSRGGGSRDRAPDRSTHDHDHPRGSSDDRGSKGGDRSRGDDDDDTASPPPPASEPAMQMQMSAYIRARMEAARWAPLLVFLHGPSAVQHRALRQMATALLTDDVQNYGVGTATSSLAVRRGTEVIVVPSFDEEYARAGCRISPPHCAMTWEQTPQGEQFFALIPENLTVAAAADADAAPGSPRVLSVNNIRIRVQFFIQAVLVGEISQIVNQAAEGAAVVPPAPPPHVAAAIAPEAAEAEAAEAEAADAEAAEAPVLAPEAAVSSQAYSVFSSVFVVTNDSNEEDREAWGALRAALSGAPLAGGIRAVTRHADAETNALLLRKAGVVQVCLSAALLRAPEALADIAMARALGKPVKCIYWSREGPPQLPEDLAYLSSTLSFYPLDTISMSTKLNDLEKKMYQTTKSTLKALSAENNFPYYSFVLTKKPATRVDEHAAGHAPPAESAGRGKSGSVLRQLFTKGKVALSALSAGLEKAKQKVDALGLKTVYVGYMCEDAACLSGRKENKDILCGHFVHEPFEIKIASDLLIRATPYLRMMRYVLKAGQLASTLAGFPIPVSIPAIPELYDAEFVAGFEAALELSDALSAEDALDNKIETAEEDRVPGALKSESRENAKNWRLLMEKHVGRDWVESTKLRQAVVSSNGNIRWVCQTCYEARWNGLCEASGEAEEEAGLETGGGGAVTPRKTSASGTSGSTVRFEGEETSAADPDMLEFLSSLPKIKQRNRVQETRQLAALVSGLQAEGVHSLQQLLFIDALWGVDDDMTAVHTYLTVSGTGFTNTQASVVVRAISEARRGALSTAPDFGCRELVVDFAKKNFPAESLSALEIDSSAVSQGAGDSATMLGPVEVAASRIRALLSMYL